MLIFSSDFDFETIIDDKIGIIGYTQGVKESSSPRRKNTNKTVTKELLCKISNISPSSKSRLTSMSLIFFESDDMFFIVCL